MQTLEKSLSTRSTTTLSHSTTMQSGAETETTIGEQSSMPERVLHELETFVGTSIKVYREMRGDFTPISLPQFHSVSLLHLQMRDIDNRMKEKLNLKFFCDPNLLWRRTFHFGNNYPVLHFMVRLSLYSYKMKIPIQL